MDYSQKTQDLIDRQCRNVERLDFTLDKPLAEELIMKTYDLFNLPRPKKVKWCVDLEDQEFQESAGSAWSAWSAGSARSARSAGSARSAWSAGSARSARSALSTGSAGSASDYDFDWYIFEYEYCQQPEKNGGILPNDNDKIYLEYCELLMQAKEAGLGYRIEGEDTLYLVPTPIVRLNSLNQYHSDKIPALYWKGGQEFYYLNDVRFEKDLWEEIVKHESEGGLSFSKRLAIKDIDQRTQALNPKWCDINKFLVETKAELLDEVNKLDVNAEKVNYKLYKIPKGDIFTEDAYYCYFDCPSTGKKHFEGVEVSKTVAEAMAWCESNEELGIVVTPEMWQRMVPLVHEN